MTERRGPETAEDRRPQTVDHAGFRGSDIHQGRLIDACVHCGFCLPSCPTYVLWGEEMDSPRGRIYLMKAALEGRASLTDTFTRHFDACLGCLACVTACPSGVQYAPLIERTRAQIERHYRRPLADRLFRAALFRVLPYPSVLRIALAPLAIAQGIGRRIFRLKPEATGVETPDATGVAGPEATGVGRPDATGLEEPDATGIAGPEATSISGVRKAMPRMRSAAASISSRDTSVPVTAWPSRAGARTARPRDRRASTAAWRRATRAPRAAACRRRRRRNPSPS